MSIKKYIPENIKLFAKRTLRSFQDLLSGDYKLFAFTKDKNTQFDFTLSITQPIKQTSFFENKCYNISKGTNAIDGLIIYPNQIFSLWEIIKNPSEQNGYKISRNIIAGSLKEDFGGGLCQVSSIIYHLSLIAGLSVKERHNHSVDIYKEDERFTPLGADSAVVYGYKDLRIQNNFSLPIKISFTMINNEVTCTFASDHKLVEHDIVFEKTEANNQIKVSTYVKMDNENILLNEANYLKN